jgi:hypothetical protein
VRTLSGAIALAVFIAVLTNTFPGTTKCQDIASRDTASEIYRTDQPMDDWLVWCIRTGRCAIV